jgi:hypothetical protein
LVDVLDSSCFSDLSVVGSKVLARLICAGVSTISLIIFGVQPSTPTSTLFPSPAGLASNSTADEFLFKSLTSTVVVLLVVRRGRDGVSRACIGASGSSDRGSDNCGSGRAYRYDGSSTSSSAIIGSSLVPRRTASARIGMVLAARTSESHCRHCVYTHRGIRRY